MFLLPRVMVLSAGLGGKLSFVDLISVVSVFLIFASSFFSPSGS